MQDKPQEPFRDAISWYLAETKKRPRRNLVAELEQRLDLSIDEAERSAYEQNLELEYLYQGEREKADALLHARIAQDSTNPINLLILAERIHFMDKNAADAAMLASKAIELADACGHFRRHARAVKARVLLDLQDYDGFGQLLDEIASIDVGKGQRDVGREADLLERAPNGKIPQDKLRKYAAYLKASSGVDQV